MLVREQRQTETLQRVVSCLEIDAVIRYSPSHNAGKSQLIIYAIVFERNEIKHGKPL